MSLAPLEAAAGAAQRFANASAMRSMQWPAARNSFRRASSLSYADNFSSTGDCGDDDGRLTPPITRREATGRSCPRDLPEAPALDPADLARARRDHSRSRVLQLPRAGAEE